MTLPLVPTALLGNVLSYLHIFPSLMDENDVTAFQFPSLSLKVRLNIFSHVEGHLFIYSFIHSFIRFYLFIHEREREAETQAEGKAGSMQGAQYGTLSPVSRITPWAEGGAKPLSNRHKILNEMLSHQIQLYITKILHHKS